MIAGLSNRWATDSVSATSLLRSAHTSSGGNIAAALSLLHSWSHDHWNARGAIRVLERHAKRGERFFRIERSGLVVGSAEAV
jgi:hypothetical protein